MKNLKLQMWFLKSLLWISSCFLILSISSCDKDDPKKEVWKRTIRTQANSVSNVNDPYTAIDGAQVYVFGSQADFSIKANAIHQGTSDANGNFTFQEDYKGGIPNKVWIWAVKGNLNTLRHHWTGEASAANTLGPPDRTNLIAVGLATTPVRLQLIVTDNSVPVSNAKVTLYETEADYLANSEPSFIETDSEGSVIYWSLEPKQYWFRVTYQSKSNSATTYYLDAPLADDPDITTVRTVAIQ